VESHVVDPASVAVDRRRRRAKTDRIDGAALLRTLMAWMRGEPRVCSMVRPPSPEAEDRRRVCRERATLMKERIEHANRIKGLLFAQGIGDYDPLLKSRRKRLETLSTGDGRPLPAQLKRQILRELDRLELTIAQLTAVEAERDASLAEAGGAPLGQAGAPGARLMQLKGVPRSARR
jgi:transposase